ncbi:MAG: hypothetical protein E3K29_05060 [Candidatus Brocadia sp.]|nr:hypothetical protein [Candidatus Brocadia sp.]
MPKQFFQIFVIKSTNNDAFDTYLLCLINNVVLDKCTTNNNLVLICGFDVIVGKHIIRLIYRNGQFTRDFTSHTEDALNKGSSGFHDHAFFFHNLCDSTVNISKHLDRFWWLPQKDLSRDGGYRFDRTCDRCKQDGL